LIEVVIVESHAVVVGEHDERGSPGSPASRTPSASRSSHFVPEAAQPRTATGCGAT